MVIKWVTATVASATLCAGFATSQVLVAPPAHGSPGYLQPCSDKDKLAVDPATGTGLVCTGKVWSEAPSVPAGLHTIGTPCRAEGVESISDNGYLIFCSSGVWTLFRE